ncbi:RES domain protein [Pedobacter cryoconitis]|uniref:RES domain protein n=1 Tax=Pedobacter cryoconitis TaxID=188932 RepID=A0A127VBT5_9SPHI|nr:HEPN-associated N-terminal domain-containing protein [Pedobacter cryoconitis]AMP98679.1 RES domain protein [Pedobacter cryoconitis]
MEQAMEYWSRGLSSVPDKKVCASHVDDYAISRFIKRNGEKDKCDYCGRQKNVVDLDALMEFLTDALTHFYTDPANFMSYVSAEGGYLGDYDGPWEMLENLGLSVEDDQLQDDIFNSLDHSSAWADEGVARSDFKYEGWLHFKHIVKHQSRFLFNSADSLRVGGRAISVASFLMELAIDIRKQRMLTIVEAGTPIYRCRQHINIDDVTEARHICSPDIKYATFPNRMSPAGVSMFYGAFDPKISKLETLQIDDVSRPYFTLAEFCPKDNLKLIDLSKIPYVSAFDQDRWELFDKVQFLHKFLDDFAKPIAHDGLQHIEYVPTQVITEYFRFAFAKTPDGKIDGIIYPSSKNRRLNACVLFFDHYESLDQLDFKESKIITEALTSLVL